jgi:hypothetical protein
MAPLLYLEKDAIQADLQSLKQSVEANTSPQGTSA